MEEDPLFGFVIDIIYCNVGFLYPWAISKKYNFKLDLEDLNNAKKRSMVLKVYGYLMKVKLVRQVYTKVSFTFCDKEKAPYFISYTFNKENVLSEIKHSSNYEVQELVQKLINVFHRNKYNKDFLNFPSWQNVKSCKYRFIKYDNLIKVDDNRITPLVHEGLLEFNNKKLILNKTICSYHVNVYNRISLIH